MKEIDNLRYLLNSIKLEISGLKNQIDEISSLCADGYFITEQKCTEAVNTLNKLIELESKVNDSFEKYVLDLPEKISAADRLIDDLEIRLLNEDKIEKLKLIKTLNPVYESNLADLYNSVVSKKCGIEVVEALLSAICSTENIETACELLEKHGFYLVEIALLKNCLYFDNNNATSEVAETCDNNENLTVVSMTNKSKTDDAIINPKDNPYAKIDLTDDIDESELNSENLINEIVFDEAQTYMSENDSEFEKSEEISDNNSADENKENERIQNTNKQIFDFLKNNPDLFKYSDDTSIVVETKPVADKKFSVTDALNFLAPLASRVNTRRIPNKIALAILLSVEWYGNLSKDVLQSKNLEIENVENTVDILYNKGYLSKIIYRSDEYYYLTGKSFASMKNSKILSIFYKDQLSKYYYCMSNRDITAGAIFNKIALYSDISYNAIDVLVPFEGQRLVLSNSIDNGKGVCLLSFVSNDLYEAKNLVSALVDKTEKLASLEKFIVGCLTITESKSLADILCSVFSDCLSKSVICCYSFDNDCYKNYNNAQDDDFNNFEEESIRSDAELDVFANADSKGVSSESESFESENVSDKEIIVRSANADEEIRNSEPEISIDVENINIEEDVEMFVEHSTEKENINVAKNKHLSWKEIESAVSEMILNDKAYCALSYLKVVSGTSDDFYALYQYVSYAYDNPMERLEYSSNSLISIESYSTYSEFTRFFYASAILRNFFYNKCEYDYNMDALISVVDIDEIPEIKVLAKKFSDFKKKNRKGIDVYTDYYLKEQLLTEKKLKNVTAQANQYVDQYIDTPYTDKTRIKRYVDTINLIFDKNGDLAKALRIVANNEKGNIDYVEKYLSGYIKDGDEINELNIYRDLVDNLIDESWDICCESDHIYKSTPLMSGKRNNLFNRIIKCLRVCAEWFKLSRTVLSNQDNPFQGSAKAEITRLIDSAIDKCKNIFNRNNKTLAAGFKCLHDTLYNLKSRLEGTFDPLDGNKYFFIDFLKTGLVTLETDINGYYTPVLKDFCPDVKDLSILGRLDRHNNAVINQEFDANFEDPSNCDLESIDIIVEYLKHKSIECNALEECVQHYRKNPNEIVNYFKLIRDEFIEKLELSQSYGMFEMSESYDIKENILNESQDIFKYSELSTNYGFYIRSIRHIQEKIEQDSKIQGKRIRESLDNLIALRESCTDNFDKQSKDTFNKCVAKINKYIDIQNYTAAEDLINRLNNNDLIEIDSLHISNDLNQYIAEYDTAYDKCNNLSISLSSGVNKKIRNYIQSNAEARKDITGGTNLISNWIKKGASEFSIRKLLEILGLNCKVEKLNNTKFDYYDCLLADEQTGNVNYQHIFAPFGSDASVNSFRIATYFGTYDSSRIISEIDNLCQYNKNTILFVDYAYKLSDRRTLSHIIKKKKYGKVYMVVDRVAIVYLAAHYQKTSILKTLMNICMPYSYYQPYVPSSSNKLPPEMFMGRVDELNKIKDPQGIHLLYGGRQLGKSALLKKAKRDIDGIDGNRSVYVDIKNSGVTKSINVIAEELCYAGIFDENIEFSSWSEFASELRNTIRRSNINYFLLLLDEGDTFIEDCKNYDYSPIDDLKRICEDTTIGFKFVIAGLHNIARFDRSSKSNNSVIPHLKTLTIKPFKYIEARQLLEYPLSSLGMYFGNDEKTQGLISTILATTNYFPGLIQFYCSQLVESLRNPDYDSIYPQTTTPPYYITEKHIQKILANKDFQEQIKEKFSITLDLDEDNYYDIIALLMADGCHSEGSAFGTTPEKIRDKGKEYGISKISNLDVSKIKVFMDELVDLNIFRSMGNDNYIFSRQNFMQFMGSDEEVFDRLCKYCDIE